MFETLLFAIVLTVFWEQRKKGKARRVKFKVQNDLDLEYRQLIESNNQDKEHANEIRNFLLAILEDNQNGLEKFSDQRLEEAGAIVNTLGANAFYWMTDIACQMSMLSAAKINGQATSVELKLITPVTAQEVVLEVVKV